MKTTKILLFVFVMAAMLLSACGGATAPEPDVPADTAGDTEGDMASDEPVKLVFWSMWNETENQAIVLQEMMDGFTALHPNITFEVVWNGRENQTKLRTALSAGTVVDFMDQDSDQLAGGMMSEGLGLALDDYLDDDFRAVFSPGVLDQYAGFDGKTYLMPHMSSPVMFWYNKDIFAEAGVPDPPKTWEEFLTTCDAITAAGYMAIVTESNVSEYDNYWLMYMIERQKGPDFLLESIRDKTGEMWKDPVYAKTISMYQDLWTRGCFQEEVKGYLWPAGQNMLATDQAGMEMAGAWLPNELSSAAREDFSWGGFAFPTIAGGSGDAGDINIWTGSMMILKDSAHPDEAFEFFKYVMETENQKTLSARAIQGVPNVNVEWPAAIADGAKAANEANMVILSAGGGLAYHPEFVKTVMNGHITSAFFGEMTPEEFSAAMAADAAAYWANR